MLLNTTYCARAFTGVYCKYMDGNVCVVSPGECRFQYGVGKKQEIETQKESHFNLRSENEIKTQTAFKIKICDKATELIDLLSNMPLVDDKFVDEITDSIRYNEPYRIEVIREEVRDG